MVKELKENINIANKQGISIKKWKPYKRPKWKFQS